MFDKLKSRKLWVSILAMVASYFYPPLIPLLKIIAPSYIIGQGAVDAATALSGK